MPDLDVDRPGRSRQYKSIQKHHHTSQNSKASKWRDRNSEKDTFDSADYGNFTRTPNQDAWEDSKNNLWGFLSNFSFVGTEKEQFGFFPSPSNEFDRWHGYPIIPFKKGYEIEQQLLDRWVEEGYIDEDDIPSLKARKRI
ncbi:hypothetical protein CN993_00790 [Bacillus thuringiensis]|uniref:hypothetical protein n=1 Tax=Bacillus thuringiensis TaxID=1428 RepID=UPI000BFE7030|nr:hypothetical protein [Bacillus thuringiensis]PGP49039.1 hypothetical protein CN993_00790 [Bacillus thuringiensis]